MGLLFNVLHTCMTFYFGRVYDVSLSLDISYNVKTLLNRTSDQQKLFTCTGNTLRTIGLWKNKLWQTHLIFLFIYLECVGYMLVILIRVSAPC